MKRANTVVLGLLLCAAGPALAAVRLQPQWTSPELRHQSEARNVDCTPDYVYTGGGGATNKIAKVRVKDGAVLWSYVVRGSSYQPSYPVSNGKVVVFGRYWKPAIVGLDDQTGQVLWEVPTRQQNMSAARFSGDLVFLGSYDHFLYALEWATGTVRWKADLGNRIWSRPWVDSGQVIIGDYNGYLHFLDAATGEVRRKIDCGGIIDSSPFATNGLVFVTAGTLGMGRLGRKMTPEEDRELVEGKGTRLLVIDSAKGTILQELKAGKRRSFSDRFLVQGHRVLFHSSGKLWSYDTTSRALAWTLEPPEVEPLPLLLGGRIILALNQAGIDTEPPPRLVVVDPDTGEVIERQATGGTTVHLSNYSQCGESVVLTDHLRAFRILRE